MAASTLTQLVIAHHRQAREMCGRRATVDELRRVGNRFTTRVEKRLRKMEANR